jgi:hypothetical protein
MKRTVFALLAYLACGLASAQNTYTLTPGQPTTSSITTPVWQWTLTETIVQTADGTASIEVVGVDYYRECGRGCGYTEYETNISSISLTDSNGNLVGTWTPGSYPISGWILPQANLYEVSYTNSMADLPAGTYTLTIVGESAQFWRGKVFGENVTGTLLLFLQ